MHTTVIIIAKYFLLLSLGITFITWWHLKATEKRRFIVLLISSGITSLLLAKIASKLYYDPRPFVSGHITPYFPHGNDNGFPSDHTLLAAFLAFTVFAYNRTLGGVALLIALLIGGSRVIAGVHHINDILGSFVIAGVSVAICFWAEAKLFGNRDTTPKDTPPEQSRS